MDDRNSLYFDGRRAMLATVDASGRVVEFVSSEVRASAPVTWTGGGGMPVPTDGDVLWAKSEDPHVRAATLARDCSAALCREESNYAKAKARLAEGRAAA